MFSFRTSKALTALVLGAAVAVATPALAHDAISMSKNATGLKTARVSFADLDLRTADGQRGLRKRVNVAVNRVCQKPNESFDIERMCRNQTSRQARPVMLAAIDRKATQLAMVASR